MKSFDSCSHRFLLSFFNMHITLITMSFFLIQSFNPVFYNFLKSCMYWHVCVTLPWKSCIVLMYLNNFVDLVKHTYSVHINSLIRKKTHFFRIIPLYTAKKKIRKKNLKRVFVGRNSWKSIYAFLNAQVNVHPK